MAIRSTFYDTAPGEGVKETEWAQSALSRGPLYGVGGPDDLKLTAHPTTPYAVNIGPGKFFGHGVWDENDSTALVQCATPAAGTTRWDLIAGRRDWQPAGGGPTSLRSVSGTAALAIPSGRENRPGVLDDQPIWLLQWKAGLPQPQQIIDLRCWAGPGGVEAAHELALTYLAEPGAAVKIGRTEHRYELQANGVWGWRSYQLTMDSGVYTPVWSGFQWRGETHISKGSYWVDGDKVTVKAMIQSGRNPSLGLGNISFSLPPGHPTAADFMSVGTGVHSTSGTGGSLRTVVPVVGPGQSSATVWVDKNPFVSPGRAGYGWGEGAAFHVQIEYRRPPLFEN